MNLRKVLTSMAAGAAIVTAGLATSSGIVSAHHPVLTAATSRPCGSSSPWTATVKAESDADYNKNWRNQHRVENPTWSSWSSFSSWVDDQTDYVVPQVTNIPSTQDFIRVEVKSEWREKDGAGGEATATRSITVYRPAATTCPTTTTTTTTAPTTTTTTTTMPPTTTTSTTSTSTSTTTSTTLPCEWDGSTQPDDSTCVPDVTIVAECFEIDVTDAIETYWYKITNNEEGPVTVKLNGGADIPLAPGENLVQADANGVTVTWNGKTVTAAAPLNDESTDVATNPDICQVEVEFVKDVRGPDPDPDGDPTTKTLYTITVSHIVIDGLNTTLEEEVTFQLADNEPTTIPLPSTLNPEGLEYNIAEVEDNGAGGSAITIDGQPASEFFANGHLGKKISVVITNDFASVQIDKLASTANVAVGQPISYYLTVTNTGAMDLSPVVIDDLFPLGVSYAGTYSIQDNAAVITCVDQADGPDWVVCTYDGVLAPGDSLPTITLNGTVNGSAAGTEILNESRVVGTYANEQVGTSAGSSDLLSTQAATPNVLSCEPTAGQVCDLSPKAATTVDTTTTTTTTTTTQVVVTTTELVTTTTGLPTTTTGLPTTTAGPSTTQDLLSEGPVPTPAPEVQLPKTGGNSNNLLLIAFLVFGAGLVITATARRRRI